MTLVALLQLSGRIGLFLFGIESVWLGILFGLIQLPQDEPEPLRSRLWTLFLCLVFGVGVMVFAVKIPAEQFTTTFPGLLAACTSPFWMAAAVAVVRVTIYAIHEIRLASRIRRHQTTERAASPDSTNPNWTDH
jgi:hypothetical protein